jgi:hypothetical protein
MEYSGILDYNRLRFLLQQKAAPLDTEKEATGQTHINVGRNMAP